MLGTEPEDLAAFARAHLRDRVPRAPTSASRAATSPWPRRARSCSSRTRATAGCRPPCPRVHVAVMGMERIVETWDQLDLMLNLLARSGTGQHLSTYTNILTGPRRDGEGDGPDELHVVILDNGRTDLLGTEFDETLNCIRCGACLNVCPVYRQVGGHAYGWVYSGPIGAVLTPLLAGEHPEAAELPDASTLCGACMDACPVQIPLQDLLLSLRRRKAESADGSRRPAGAAWSPAWSRPVTYRASMKATALGRPLARLAAFAARPAAPGPAAAPCPCRRRGASPSAGRRARCEQPRDRRPARPRCRPGSGARPVEAPDEPRPPHARAARPACRVAASRLLDPDDLVGSFVRNAALAGAVVHRMSSSDDPDELVADARRATPGRPRRSRRSSRRPGPIVEQLGAAGVEVAPFDRARRPPRPISASPSPPPASPRPARSSNAATRSAAAPPACCPPSTCASCRPAGSWRRRPTSCGPAGDQALPSNLVLVTGPSKSGDIEQIIVTGVHGPVALELCVVVDI